MFVLTLVLLGCVLAPTAYSANVNDEFDQQLQELNDLLEENISSVKLTTANLFWDAVQSDVVLFGLNTMRRTGDCSSTETEGGDFSSEYHLGPRAFLVGISKLKMGDKVTSDLLKIGKSSFMSKISNDKKCNATIDLAVEQLDKVTLYTPEGESDVSDLFQNQVRHALNAYLTMGKEDLEKLFYLLCSSSNKNLSMSNLIRVIPAFVNPALS